MFTPAKIQKLGFWNNSVSSINIWMEISRKKTTKIRWFFKPTLDHLLLHTVLLASFTQKKFNERHTRCVFFDAFPRFFTVKDTDYGCQIKPFFHRNPKLLGLNIQFGQVNFWVFGVFFGWFISTHFGTVSPLSMFSIIQPLFL